MIGPKEGRLSQRRRREIVPLPFSFSPSLNRDTRYGLSYPRISLSLSLPRILRELCYTAIPTRMFVD